MSVARLATADFNKIDVELLGHSDADFLGDRAIRPLLRVHRLTIGRRISGPNTRNPCSCRSKVMPGKDPNISVVIPCYNAAPFLRESIESVLRQTLSPLEIIVVDDGSTDESAAVAEAYGAPVRVLRQENQGESVARNRGIEESRGEWIAYLDADDIWETRKLELQVATLGQSDIVLVHTGWYCFGDKEGIDSENALSMDGHYELETMLNEGVVLPSSAMVRADLSVRFPTWTRHGEDVIYFAELSMLGGFSHVDCPLVGWRQSMTQQHKGQDHFARQYRSRWQWVESIESRVGAERVAQLKRAIRVDLVEKKMRMAYWQRDWDRYWKLRDFANRLDWPEGKPAALSERIYPQFAYKLKDYIDRCRRFRA